MNQIELDRSLRKLRLSGMAATLPTRILQAQAEHLSPHDFLASLVADELTRRTDRLVERRVKHAGFRDRGRALDNFDFTFNPEMDKKLIFELASCRFPRASSPSTFLGFASLSRPCTYSSA